MQIRSVLTWSIIFVACGLVSAQDRSFSLFPSFGSKSSSEEKLSFSSSFKTARDGHGGILSITAKLGPGWHIYSTSQKPGGPKKTEFMIKTEEIKVVGPFTPDKPPHVKRDNIFPGVDQEEHAEQVTWSAPIEISANFSAIQDLGIKILAKGQICNENPELGCIPIFGAVKDPNFIADFAGIDESLNVSAGSKPNLASTHQSSSKDQPPVAKKYVPSLDGIMAMIPTKLSSGSIKNSRAKVSGEVVPANVKPGDTVQLKITVSPDPGWHVYAYAKKKEPDAISSPTIFGIASPRWSFTEPKASQPPILKQTGLPMEPVQQYHSSTTTWTLDLTVPENTPAGSTTLHGVVGYQLCTETSCDRPTAVEFVAELNVGDATSGSAMLSFAPTSYSKAGQVAEGKSVDEPSRPTTSTSGDPNAFDLSRIIVEPRSESLVTALALALLGGFVLNFMPCVLPVIGLKVMSFVQQSGEDRKRTMLLNVWYAIGMLSIFWVLAGLAAFWSLGWGQQFNDDRFTIALIAIVFVMGLSFLGVWEIPIPGFASSGKATELADKEGYSGAFFKGVITTILATPCSGPGIATALAYCAKQPPATVFLIFTFIGLGMAFPYLVIGAFPRLVRFIPKPGAWMDTFKQLMGFVLLGTVVFLFTQVSPAKVVPTIAFIFALWAGCWWIGRVSIGEAFSKKASAWIAAVAFSALIGYFAFAPKTKSEHHLDWEKFSLAHLKELTDSQTTVMVEFTADW